MSLRLSAFLSVLAVPAFAVTSFAAAVPAEVAVQQSGIGTHFTNAKGFTLYTYDRDEKPGVSSCTEKCAEAWPPLVAPKDAAAVGDWAPIARADGSQQWAWRGKPIYTYIQDKQPGATLGSSVQDVWHVAVDLVPRPRAVTFHGTILGRVAADSKGMTLYSGEASCTGACLKKWTPLPAPWAASAIGDWSLVVREDDGTKQWAYKGKPLYTYTMEVRPGETRAEGFEKGWHAVILQPTPALPSWVTVRTSDYGPIFADARGMTLYSVGADFLPKIKKETCNDACMKANFTPIVAAADAAPTGNWGVMVLSDGTRQWTYRGQPVFTFNNDKNPSEINGDRFAIGAGFGSFRVLTQLLLREEAF